MNVNASGVTGKLGRRRYDLASPVDLTVAGASGPHDSQWTALVNPAVPKPPVHVPDAAYLAWLRTQPCAVCGKNTYGDPVESAHLDSRRYGDLENAIPLCGFAHHREGKFALHRLGRPKFAVHWNIDLKATAQRLTADWERTR